MWHYQTLVSATHEIIQNSTTETINVKYQEEHGMKSLKCPMDIILSTSSRSMKQSLVSHQSKYLYQQNSELSYIQN